MALIPMVGPAAEAAQLAAGARRDARQNRAQIEAPPVAEIEELPATIVAHAERLDRRGITSE